MKRLGVALLGNILRNWQVRKKLSRSWPECVICLFCLFLEALLCSLGTDAEKTSIVMCCVENWLIQKVRKGGDTRLGSQCLSDFWTLKHG